jgi:hypothetical protein
MTSADQPIDLMQDLANLYAREEMLAFFDFTVECRNGAPVCGLCRIARPKQASSGAHYISLTFVVDTPDEAARAAAQTAIDRIAPQPLRAVLPEVREVIAVPSINSTPDSYVAQADLLMHSDPTRPFITGQLVPAVAKLARMTVTDLTWWSSSPAAPRKDAPATAKSRPPLAEAQGSLVTRLSTYLKQQLGLQ